jgi:hypothetical protein
MKNIHLFYLEKHLIVECRARYTIFQTNCLPYLKIDDALQLLLQVIKCTAKGYITFFKVCADSVKSKEFMFLFPLCKDLIKSYVTLKNF